MWNISLTAVFGEWWAELSEQDQDDVKAIVELLEEMEPKLPFPYSSCLEASRHGHMSELRIQAHGDPLRISDASIPPAAPSC